MRRGKDLDREDLLGYRVCAAGREACVADITGAIRSRGPFRWLACLNPHSYVEARKEEARREAFARADWLVPDGVGIVLASRLRGGRIRFRVTGHDIFIGVNDALNREGGKSVFFLGSTQRTLSLIRGRMKRDWPRLRVAGTYSPPFVPEFGERENDAMVRAVNRAKPDVLWVGMTAPKQEKWIHRNRKKLKVRFAGAVGAVFDFYAGTVRRAPGIFRKTGLEWLYRLLREPCRMWRRYLVNNFVFLACLLQDKGVRREN